MDTLTHALSGALLGRATAPASPRSDQLPLRWRIPVGFLAAAFPDSDFVLWWIRPEAYLVEHRGITHSVLMLPLWATALAFLFVLLARQRYGWRAFVGLCALGIGVHIFADIITAFGTMVFAPLSDMRIAWPTTFIIDLYFSGILIVGLVASAIWRRRRSPAVIALALLAAYIASQAYLHERALDIGEAYARSHDARRATVRAVPQPLSPFNWMVIVVTRDHYDFAYVNLLRDRPPPAPAPDAGIFARLDAAYAPPSQAIWNEALRFGQPGYAQILAQEAWRQEAFRPYRHFSLLPVLYGIDTQSSTCVWFYDLRFSLPIRAAPFTYGMCRSGTNGKWQVAVPSR